MELFHKFNSFEKYLWNGSVHFIHLFAIYESVS